MRVRKLWAGYRFQKPGKISHSDSRGRPGGCPGAGSTLPRCLQGTEHGAARLEEDMEESTGPGRKRQDTVLTRRAPARGVIQRRLITNFAVSDLRIKYRNSVLGFMWTFLEPLLMLGVLYVVFTNVFRNDIEHFPLYLLLGLIVYNAMQRGTDMGLSSIVSKSGLMTQVFIRQEVPAVSATMTAGIMLCLEMVVFGIFMAAFGFLPTATVLLLFPILALELVLILGLNLPLSVLNVRFNDVQFIWRVIMQAGFFLTPIFYTMEILPGAMRGILEWTPMVQIMVMARDVAIYDSVPEAGSVLIAVGTTLAVLGAGYAVFRAMRARIVEML